MSAPATLQPATTKQVPVRLDSLAPAQRRIIEALLQMGRESKAQAAQAQTAGGAR